MYFISSIPAMFLVLFSFFAACPMARGHLILNTPVPYGAYANPAIDNSPLDSSGANYPCKVTSDPATWYSQANIDNTYAAGSVQTLSFNGSAVHGGGSCQLAITNDMQPSAQTSWRVILSIESGCPTTDGTNPATYNWTVPADLTPGKYSFAWTWISKEAGQPEYYMNCAPITVTASPASRKRSLVERRAAAAAAAAASSDYPELFVANLESINSCKIGPDVDPLYPAPGPIVEKLLTGSTADFASVTIGSNCVPLSQTQSNSFLPVATAGVASNTTTVAAGLATGAVSTLPLPTAAAAVARSGSIRKSPTASSTSVAVFATSTSSAVLNDSSSTATPEAATTTSTDGGSSTMTLSVYVSPVTPGKHSTLTSTDSVVSSESSATLTSSDDFSTTVPYTTTTTAEASSSTVSTGSTISVTPIASSSTITSSQTASMASVSSSSSRMTSTTKSSSASFTQSSSSTSLSSTSESKSLTVATTTSTTSAKATTIATTTATSSAPSSTSTSSSSSSNSTASSSGASTKSGTCTDEGMFNCVGSEYQQCASGGWTTMQALPAGTTCQQGESMGLWARSSSISRVKLLRDVRRRLKEVLAGPGGL